MANYYDTETLDKLSTPEIQRIYANTRDILQRRLECTDKELLNDFLSFVAKKRNVPLTYYQKQTHMRTPAAKKENTAYSNFIKKHFAGIRYTSGDIHSLTAEVFETYFRENYDMLKEQKTYPTPLGYAKLLTDIEDIFAAILPDYVSNGMIGVLLGGKLKGGD